MLTFTISVILTSFICLCFYKKNFWENRYIVLLISGCVALVATLTINFATRGHLETKTESSIVKAITTFYVPTDVAKSAVHEVDTNGTLKLQIVKDYNWYGKHDAKEFLKDTTKKQVPVTILLYSYGKHQLNKQVATFTKKGNQNWYRLDAIYFVKSSADTIAYVSEKRQYYNVNSKWIAGFSLPRKASITILHVPPSEFALIPDSLIRPIPF